MYNKNDPTSHIVITVQFFLSKELKILQARDGFETRFLPGFQLSDQ